MSQYALRARAATSRIRKKVSGNRYLICNKSSTQPLNCQSAVESAKLRQFHPKLIHVQCGSVGIYNNAARETPRSNITTELADEYRKHVVAFRNNICNSINESCSASYEQIWSGIEPLFHLWKSAIQPFNVLQSIQTGTAESSSTHSSQIQSANIAAIDLLHSNSFSPGISIEYQQSSRDHPNEWYMSDDTVGLGDGIRRNCNSGSN